MPKRNLHAKRGQRAKSGYSTYQRGRTHGSNDMAQKTLLGKNEIFADVLNGFIFKGKQVIKAEMLQDTNTTSIYKADGKIHSQDRDVAKLLTIGSKKVVILLVGIENQTRPDKNMAARVMSYDAAAYRYQLTKSKELYPVLTVVVYYGKEAWNYSRSLRENINMQVLPKEMWPLISDYEIKAFFRISDLSKQEINNRFKSAFFYVAEYFVQTNAGEEYHPSAKDVTVEDLQLVLDMMNSMSSSQVFEEAANTLNERKEDEVTNMTKVLNPYTQVRVDRAIKETTERVTRETTERVARETTERVTREVTKEVSKETTEKVTTHNLISLIKSASLTPDKAMDLLGIPEAERPLYRKLLQKNSH